MSLKQEDVNLLQILKNKFFSLISKYFKTYIVKSNKQIKQTLRNK